MKQVEALVADVALDAEKDERLVSLTRLGDMAAYAELWRRHAPAGLAAAKRTTKSFDPEDLVAEAYASILEAIRNEHGPTGPFRPYLVAVVRNIAGRWGRSLQETTVEDFEALIDERSVREEEDRDEDRELALAAYRTLKPRWQQVLWMLEVNGLKPREVARRLDMRPNAVSALALRAREALRLAWIEAHIRSDRLDASCEVIVGLLPAYAGKKLGARDTSAVKDHLRSCKNCARLQHDAEHLVSRLRSWVVPVVLGGSTAAAASSGLLGGSSSAVAFNGSSLLSSSLGAKGTVLVIAGAAASLTGLGVLAIQNVPATSTPVSSAADSAQDSNGMPSSAGAAGVPIESSDDEAGDESQNASTTVAAANDVTPAVETTAVPETGMSSPGYSFQLGASFSAKKPELSGYSLPSARIILIIAGKTGGYQVHSVEANSLGAWELPLPDIPNGDYSVWAYQEANGKRSDARGTEFGVNRAAYDIPEITAVRSQGGRLLPLVSGFGEPGSIVVVSLNGVSNRGVVASNGKWTVVTARGGVVGDNSLEVTQYDPGTLVYSEASETRSFRLSAPEASVEGFSSDRVLTVNSQPGSAVEVEDTDGIFSHRVLVTQGLDTAAMQIAGVNESNLSELTVRSRYISPSGDRWGPWSDEYL